MFVVVPRLPITHFFSSAQLALLPLLLALGVTSKSFAQERVPVLILSEKADSFAELFEDLSVWQQHLEHPEGRKVHKRERGVYPIGDGHVFTYLGLGRRANTMQALSGPSYQTKKLHAPKGHFGEMSLDLLEGGTVQAVPMQSLWRTRGSNIVISEDATRDKEGLSLKTVNFALAGRDSIYRWVEVENRGKRARTLSLRIDWEHGRIADKASVLIASDDGMGFEAELASVPKGTSDGRYLTIPLGAIPAGKTKTVVLTLRTKKKDSEYQDLPADENTLIARLAACVEHWRKRLENTTSLRIDRKDIGDLLEDWKVLMLVQRAEPSGAVVPMINKRAAFVRNMTGALLAFLRYGLFTEAKQLLDFIHDAAVVSGGLQDSYAIDLNLEKADELAEGFDYTKLSFDASELPGWVILQHEWYYRATWDKEYLKKRYPFLLACMRSMQPGADGAMATSGKESYLHGAFFSLFPLKVKHPAYLPSDAPGKRARSFDNSLVYLIAANAMAELGEDYDSMSEDAATGSEGWVSKHKVEFEQTHISHLLAMEQSFWMPEKKRFAPFISGVTQQRHALPYAAVNLRPQWIGYTYAIGEKNRENFQSTVRSLWQDQGRIGMTPSSGYTTGEVQGLLLYSMADLDDSERNRVLDRLVEMAKPHGGWGELYDPEGRPIASYHANWPGRIRPLESGMNIDALFFALNGIRYVCSPGWSKKDQRFKLRLPNGSKWYTMKNIRHDGHLFNIFLDERMLRDLKIDEKGGLVRKLRFRLNYRTINLENTPRFTSGTPYVDTAINVGEEVYVRYPTLEEGVNEACAWPVDKQKYLRIRKSAGRFQLPTIAVDGDYDTLLLTAKVKHTNLTKTFVVDIGNPITPQQLANLVLLKDPTKEDGKLLFDRILFDVGARDRNTRTMKTSSFWNHPVIVAANRQFRRLGGKILMPRFITRYQTAGPFPAQQMSDLDKQYPLDLLENFRKEGWLESKLDNPMRLDLGRVLRKGGRSVGKQPYIAYASSIVISTKAQECNLRLGSDDGLKVFLNGKEVHKAMQVRDAVADSDEVLIQLQKGENKFLFKIFNKTGKCQLIARLTDLDGLPLVGLSYR